MVSKQKHDLGRKKRHMNDLRNPRALTKSERTAKRTRQRVTAALDLFHKEGRWPRGWDANKPDRAKRDKGFGEGEQPA